MTTRRPIAAAVPPMMPHFCWLSGSCRLTRAMTTALSPERRRSIHTMPSSASQKTWSNIEDSKLGKGRAARRPPVVLVRLGGEQLLAVEVQQLADVGEDGALLVTDAALVGGVGGDHEHVLTDVHVTG